MDNVGENARRAALPVLGQCLRSGPREVRRIVFSVASTSLSSGECVAGFSSPLLLRLVTRRMRTVGGTASPTSSGLEADLHRCAGCGRDSAGYGLVARPDRREITSVRWDKLDGIFVKSAEVARWARQP